LSEEQPITKKDMEKWTKAIADKIGELSSKFPQPSQRQYSESGHEEGGEGNFCPDCGVMVKDVFAHLKKEPEKHGLVKTVEKEVVKEVPKKRQVSEILAEHDLFDCPDCRKVIDEHLSKKGLEITKKKEEGTEGVLDWL